MSPDRIKRDPLSLLSRTQDSPRTGYPVQRSVCDQSRYRGRGSRGHSGIECLQPLAGLKVDRLVGNAGQGCSTRPVIVLDRWYTSSDTAVYHERGCILGTSARGCVSSSGACTHTYGEEPDAHPLPGVLDCGLRVFMCAGLSRSNGSEREVVDWRPLLLLTSAQSARNPPQSSSSD